MLNWYRNFRIVQAASEQDIDEWLEYIDRDPWQEVDSSFIDALAYYEGASVLEVRMDNGKIYTFMGVPKNVYEAFLKAPSKGVYFNKVLRPKYTTR